MESNFAHLRTQMEALLQAFRGHNWTERAAASRTHLIGPENLLWRYGQAALQQLASPAEAIELLSELLQPEVIQMVGHLYGERAGHLLSAMVLTVKAALSPTGTNNHAEAAAEAFRFGWGQRDNERFGRLVMDQALAWLQSPAGTARSARGKVETPILLTNSVQGGIWFATEVGDDQGDELVPDMVRLGLLQVDDTFLGSLEAARAFVRSRYRRSQKTRVLSWWLRGLGGTDAPLEGASGGAAMAVALSAAVCGSRLKRKVAISATLTIPKGSDCPDGSLGPVEGEREKWARADAVFHCRALLLHPDTAKRATNNQVPEHATQLVKVKHLDEAWRHMRQPLWPRVVLAALGLCIALALSVAAYWGVTAYAASRSDASEVFLESFTLVIDRPPGRIEPISLVAGGVDLLVPFQIKPINSQPEDRRQRDRIRFIGKLNHSARWWLLHVDTKGQADVLARPDDMEKELFFPRGAIDPDSGWPALSAPFRREDPPGTHLFIVLVGEPEGGEEAIKRQVGAIGKPPPPPPRGGPVFRARGMDGPVEGERQEEDLYLGELKARLPNGVKALRAILLETSRLP